MTIKEKKGIKRNVGRPIDPKSKRQRMIAESIKTLKQEIILNQNPNQKIQGHAVGRPINPTSINQIKLHIEEKKREALPVIEQ